MERVENITQKTNVSALERLGSTAVGSMLVLNVARKPSLRTVAGALLGTDLIYRGVTGHCHLYGALGVNTAATNQPGSQINGAAPEIQRSITIGRSREEAYSLWSNPENFALVMGHFAEVRPEGEGITHWRVRGPLKQVFEWRSEQTEEEPGRVISWQSLAGSQLPNRGRVSFREAPNGIGTEVTVTVRFQPPLGSIGAQISKALHLVPRSIAGTALRRFKSLAETGEIPTLEHNPSGRGASDAF
jgi:uncharacterized membrane protein